MALEKSSRKTGGNTIAPSAKKATVTKNKGVAGSKLINRPSKKTK